MYIYALISVRRNSIEMCQSTHLPVAYIRVHALIELKRLNDVKQ